MNNRSVSDILLSWSNILGMGKLSKGEITPDLSREQDLVKVKSDMEKCLVSKGGVVTARTNSIHLGRSYLRLSDEGKLKFLVLLLEEFGTNRSLINEKIDKYINTKDGDMAEMEHELAKALIPNRVQILKQFNALDSGVDFLVRMREDVIKLSKINKGLKPLEIDLYNILTSWFDVGLLDMREITWDEPASLLEKLIEYEAVHKIKSWDDLRHRLNSDRKCFAFFHHKMPNEPLIFVEVALVDDVSSNVEILLDENAQMLIPMRLKLLCFIQFLMRREGCVV